MTTQGWSVAKDWNELESLRNRVVDDQTRGILDFVRSDCPEIQQQVRNNAPLKSDPDVGTCLQAATAIRDALRSRSKGLNVRVLQGDVPLKPKSWLEHHIAWIEGSHRWATIDLTAKQIPRLANAPLVVIVSDPDVSVLKNALRATYDWWFPNVDT